MGGGKKTHTLVLALAHSSDGFSTQVDHFYLLLVNQFFFMLFSVSPGFLSLP